jgi:autotransporter-associated beta strand protein
MGTNSDNTGNTQFESRPSTLSEGNWDGIDACDMDGDGRAEVLLKTANGVIFGDGKVLSVPGASPDAQYISVLDGMTGAEKARIAWPADFISDGPMGMSFAIAYLDGIHPSLVVKGKNRQTSGAFNMLVCAFNYDGTTLNQQWKWYNNTCPDGHQMRVADVNNDGKDEILEVPYALNSDGTVLYNLGQQGIQHGDRFTVTDIDPDRPGLETFLIQQDNGSLLATAYLESATGNPIKKWYAGGVVDVARGMAIDIDPSHKGCEMFSTMSGIWDCKGNLAFANSVWPPEGLWWDADLGREFIDGAGDGQLAPTIQQFNPGSDSSGRMVSLYHENVHQAYGGRPAFWGDILGDWREEVVVVANDYSALRIFVSTTPATNRIYTLMQDPAYHGQASIKGYVQASFTDYYLGWDMTPPQPPPQINSTLVWRGGTGNVWDGSTPNWRTNWFFAGNANTNPVVCNPGNSVLFDTTGSNNTAIALSGALTPGDVTVYAPKDFMFDGSAGSLGGTMKLTKVGAGKLTITGSHPFTGKTVVWDGELQVNGDLQGSLVTVWGGTWGGAMAAGKTGGRISGTGRFSQPVTVKYRGAITPGAGMNNPGTLTFGSGLTLENDSAIALDLSDDPTGATKTNDLINIAGNLIVTGTNHIVINRINTTLPAGTVYPLINYSGAFVGSLAQFDIRGLTGIPVALTNPPGQIALVMKSFRPPAAITWTGGSGGNAWDLLTTPNWLNGGVKDMFAPNDTVRFDDSGASNSTVNLSGDLNCANIVVDSTANFTLTGSGDIIGTASLTKTNSGTLTINTFNNTFTGKTTVAGGTLVVSTLGAVGSPSALGNPPGGTTNLVLSGSATLRITSESFTDRGMTFNAGTNTLDIVNGQLTMAGQIVGSGGLLKMGSGTLALNAVNTYTGPTVIKGGGINLGGGNTVNQYGLGAGPGGNGNTTVTLDGGSLTMYSDTGSYDACYWNIVVPTNSAGTIYSDDRCNLYGSLTGGGTFNFNVYYTRCELDGNWSGFTGQINVGTDSGGGDFRLGNTYGYANASVNLAAGIGAYHISGSGVAIGALSGSVGSSLNGTPWTIGAKNTDATFAGNINGNSVTKIGTGTWTLTGTNNYSGTTTVSAGTLRLGNPNALGTGSGAVTVAATATLAGNGIIGGTATINGRLDPGSSFGTLIFSNSLTLTATSSTLMEISKSPLNNDLAKVTGTLTCGGTLIVTNLAGTLASGDSFKLFGATTYAGSFSSFNLPSLTSGLAWDTSALNTSGILSVIAVQTGPPSGAPTNLVAVAAGSSRINLTWGDNSTNETSFLIESSTNNIDFTQVGSVGAGVTAYQDTGLAANTTYYYRVRASNLSGNSAYSNVASATTSAASQMIKSDTITMNTAADWSGVTPAAGAIGLFNNVISSANESALILGGDVTVGGLIFTNNLNGAVTIAAGNTLTLGGAGVDMGVTSQNVTFSNAINLAALQTWNVATGRNLAIYGALTSASNNVTKTGGGTLNIGTTTSDPGANIQVNAGTVQANANSGITISLNGGSFNINTFDSNPINVMSGGTEQNIGGNRTWGGNLAGTGQLTVIVSSTHTWSGSNSAYTGAITLQGTGSLRLSSVNAVSATTAYTFNNGTMNANASGLFNLGSLSGIGTINSAAGQNFSIGARGENTTFDGVIAGGGFVVKTGGGALTLNGANTYSGGTAITGGTLQIGSDGTTGSPGPGNVTNNAALAFNRSDSISDSSFGVISGAGSLAQTGDGTLTLNQVHTYMGATLIQSGTLALSGSGSIAGSTNLNIFREALLDVGSHTGGGLTLANGQTLSGNGAVNGNLTIGSGAILAAGNPLGTLTFSNSLTLSAGSTTVMEISKSPLANDSVTVLGSLHPGGVLVVTNISGLALSAGDSFPLFNAGTVEGSFNSLVFPALGTNLVWDTNSFLISGTLAVISTRPPAFNAVTALGDGNFRLTYSGPAGRDYELRATTDLMLAPVTLWDLLGSGTFGEDPATFDDLSATNSPQKFYRIVVP